MKKLHFIKLSLAASVLASGTAIANEDTESKIANLESQMAALREDVKSNNLDTLSKLHMAGYANVDAIAGSDRQEDGFTAARFAPIFHFQFSDRVLFSFSSFSCISSEMPRQLLPAAMWFWCGWGLFHPPTCPLHSTGLASLYICGFEPACQSLDVHLPIAAG